MKAYFAEMERCSGRLLDAFCVGFGLPRGALHPLFQVGGAWCCVTFLVQVGLPYGPQPAALHPLLDARWCCVIFMRPNCYPAYNCPLLGAHSAAGFRFHLLQGAHTSFLRLNFYPAAEAQAGQIAALQAAGKEPLGVNHHTGGCRRQLLPPPLLLLPPLLVLLACRPERPLCLYAGACRGR